MARSNKYTSLNFNDIYEKKITTSPSSSSSSTTSSLTSSNKSYSLSASSRLTHGGMLVLSRPSPKPISPPSPKPGSNQTRPELEPNPDPISLRPLGKTGTTSFPTLERDTNINTITKEGSLVSPCHKSDKFVPPHLRPGYVPCQQNLPPEARGVGVGGGNRGGGFRPGSGHGNKYGEDVRPKSGGGYDRRVRGVATGDSDLGEFYRPRSGGSRPSSSG